MSGTEILYIKGDAYVEVTTEKVTLGDLVSMECANNHLIAKLKTMKILSFRCKNERDACKGKHRAVVSILEIISKIHEENPGIQVENYGASDIIITYKCQKKVNSVYYWAKVMVIVLICASGAAFSVMAFNNDVNTTKLFTQIYELLTGNHSDGFTILEITYCIGIVIGILAFFNHFGKKRFSTDPTPMEVEMRLYENDLQTTIVENYARKGKELDVD